MSSMTRTQFVALPNATPTGTNRPSSRFQVRAEVAQGEERDRLFEAQAAQMPNFAEYQQETSRRIPVVTLQRMT
jgi:hypothetical protein